MGVRPVIAALALLLSSYGLAADQTYDDVIKGKSCKESGSQRLDCTYRVGRDLYIAIAGIGMPDTGINFYASSLEGDYYASVGCCMAASSSPPENHQAVQRMKDMPLSPQKTAKSIKTGEAAGRGIDRD